jgi:hypothetical protein
MSDGVYTYVKRKMEMSLLAPPDTDFQCGYLAALLVLADDVLGFDMNKPPFAEAEKLCLTEKYRINRYECELSRCRQGLKELNGEQS